MLTRTPRAPATGTGSPATGAQGFVDRLSLRWAARADRADRADPAPGVDGAPAPTRNESIETARYDGPPAPPDAAPDDPAGHGRRSFLGRVTLVASALTVDPLRFLMEPVSAWDAVCGSGNTCGEGWSVFCCTINNGQNACPSGSFVAGWWKSDASAFCGGGPRYILDCNQFVDVSCTCYCPTHSCDNRRTCCNQFRYGQCHQEIAAYGPVRCRLVSCVAPWQIDATCTTTSATDNRTSDHNAPCNTYGPPPPPPPPPAPGAMPSTGPVVLNADGRLEAFGIAAGSGVLTNVYQYEIGQGWSGWSPIGAGGWPLPNGVSIGRNANGRLQAFLKGASGQINTTRQGPIGTGWSAFGGLGGNFLSPPAVARNHDGRLEVFAVGVDGKLKHNWQNAKDGDNWYGWVDFGGSFAGEPAVATTADGRLFVVCVGTDQKLHGMAQNVPNGVWTPVVKISDTLHQGRPAIGRNANGTLAIACLDVAGRLVTYQPSGFGWAEHQQLTKVLAKNPCVGRNQDGRLEIFSVAADGTLHHSWQSTPAGTFVEWFPMAMPPSTTFVDDPSIIANPDGRLEVFMRGADGRLWHDFQLVPNGAWFGPTHLGGNLAE